VHRVKNTSYWLDTEPAPPVLTPGPLPDRCDVAVIGGGLTGLMVALELARDRQAVRVFDKGRVAGGASSRNAGQTLAGLKPSPHSLIKTYGPARAVELYRATLDAIAFTESFVGREHIECHFHRHGALWCAYSARHHDGLVAARDLLASTFRHETHVVSRADLGAEIGSDYYHGGLVDPLSAGLHPGKLVMGLLARAMEAGVGLHENTPVESVQRTPRGFRLTTPAGTIEAAQVAVATNGYTPEHLSWFRRRVIPIGSYIVVTAPLGEACARSILPRGRMAFDTKKFLFYFRLTPDRRLLFGGRTSFARIDDGEACRILAASMREVFPQLADCAVDYSWSGNVGFTFDQLPHIGEHEGMHFAMGYCGHGVANSLYFGHHLANLMRGQQGTLPFAELPFPARFFYRRHPWFLPLAGGYFKVVDGMERR
jgi:glycine/D-amino acid oxidase-like deaminating enzyme